MEGSSEGAPGARSSAGFAGSSTPTAAAHAEVLQYSDLPTADVEQLAVILLIFGNLSHITQISVNKKVFLQKFPLNFLHFVADLQDLACHDCSGHN